MDRTYLGQIGRVYHEDRVGILDHTNLGKCYPAGPLGFGTKGKAGQSTSEASGGLKTVEVGDFSG